MKYTTYIIYSRASDKFYIGQTNNLEIRFRQHNEDRKSYASKYRPWKLVYQESFNSRSDALKLEKYLKSLKNKERIKLFIAGWRSSTSKGS